MFDWKDNLLSPSLLKSNMARLPPCITPPPETKSSVVVENTPEKHNFTSEKQNLTPEKHNFTPPEKHNFAPKKYNLSSEKLFTPEKHNFTPEKSNLSSDKGKNVGFASLRMKSMEEQSEKKSQRRSDYFKDGFRRRNTIESDVLRTANKGDESGFQLIDKAMEYSSLSRLSNFNNDDSEKFQSFSASMNSKFENYNDNSLYNELKRENRVNFEQNDDYGESSRKTNGYPDHSATDDATLGVEGENNYTSSSSR